MNARIDEHLLVASEHDAFAPGRSCPLTYRYAPSSLATLPAENTETLYCVGGLYGNVFALGALDELLKHESPNETRVVFNGDFHWFDATPSAFAEIEHHTLRDSRYLRLRGNVETEISSDDDTGCGCSYPDDVDDHVVNRSNEILRHLRHASLNYPTQREALAALPMSAAFRVGSCRIVVVHGDLESLSGWRLDPKALDQADELTWALRAVDDAQADIVASSHTCLPALRTHVHNNAQKTIINNGAAGMPSFRDTRFGVVTRIARSSAAAVGVAPLYGIRHDDVWIEAIALHFDFDAWRAHFLSMWPQGSAAHESYFSRIEHGVGFTHKQALGIRT